MRFRLFAIITAASLIGAATSAQEVVPTVCSIGYDSSGVYALCDDGRMVSFAPVETAKTVEVQGKKIVRRVPENTAEEGPVFVPNVVACTYTEKGSSDAFRKKLLEDDILNIAYGREPVCYPKAGFKKQRVLPFSPGAPALIQQVLDQNLSPPTSCSVPTPPSAPIVWPDFPEFELPKLPEFPDLPKKATPFRPSRFPDAIMDAMKKHPQSNRSKAKICIAIDQSGSMTDGDFESIRASALKIGSFLKAEYPNGALVSFARYSNETGNRVYSRNVPIKNVAAEIRALAVSGSADEDHSRVATDCLDAIGKDPDTERITILISDELPGSDQSGGHPADELNSSKARYRKTGARLVLIDPIVFQDDVKAAEAAKEFMNVASKDPAWEKYRQEFMRVKAIRDACDRKIPDSTCAALTRNDPAWRDTLEKFFKAEENYQKELAHAEYQKSQLEEVERLRVQRDSIIKSAEANADTINLAFDQFSLADYDACLADAGSGVHRNPTITDLETETPLTAFSPKEIAIKTFDGRIVLNRKTGKCAKSVLTESEIRLTNPAGDRRDYILVGGKLDGQSVEFNSDVDSGLATLRFFDKSNRFLIQTEKNDWFLGTHTADGNLTQLLSQWELRPGVRVKFDGDTFTSVNYEPYPVPQFKFTQFSSKGKPLRTFKKSIEAEAYRKMILRPAPSFTGKSYAYVEFSRISGSYKVVWNGQKADGTSVQKVLFEAINISPEVNISPKERIGSTYDFEVNARSMDPKHQSRAVHPKAFSNAIGFEQVTNSNTAYLLTADGMVRFFDLEDLENREGL